MCFLINTPLETSDWKCNSPDDSLHHNRCFFCLSNHKMKETRGVVKVKTVV